MTVANRPPRLFLLAAFLVASFARAALPEDFDLKAPLPVDPQVRVGSLSNGLRFYIRENSEPEGRASLRLVVNAGSLQEEENQRGIAHFIEHMAFNGTEHFEKQELVSFLESLGMSFGQHLNASTSFDQTIYQLEIPLDDPAAFEKGLLILEDWAGGIAFDPFEIEKERGVIVEEWRSRQGAGWRVRDQQYPVIYYNSRYADRLAIGSMFVVRNAPPERFRAFYRDWYRPNLMAVIAVGDFDGEYVENEIVRRFSKLENPEGAPPRLNYEVPDHEQTLFSIVSDPEVTGTSLRVYWKADPDPDSTGEDYRRHLVERIYFSILNRRLDERTRSAAPPYLGAEVGRTSLGREKKAYTASANFLEGHHERGAEALFAEIGRAVRDGFSQDELARVKADTKRWIDRIYAERENTPADVLAEEYTRAFLVDEPIPGIELERDMTHAFLDTIGLEEVNAVGAIFGRSENRVALFVAPQKEDLAAPTEAELMTAMQAGWDFDLGAYYDEVSDEPLMEEEPTPGSIASETYHEIVDTHEWTLSNGARVLVKSTDFKNDQILMSAFSEGGHSLVMDDEYVAAITSTMLVGESGVRVFNPVQLEKKLAGTAVSISPSLTESYESFSGSCSPQDLDTFFKLLHLQVTQPNVDQLPVAFESVEKRVSALVLNRQQSPSSVFQDAIESKLYGDHPRHRPLSLELLSEMDPWLSLEIYKDRFQNAGDFTFVFVGAIDLDSFRGYVEKYLASLPTRGSPPEKARFLGDRLEPGFSSVVVRKGLEEKTTARVLFYGDAEWSPEDRFALSFARDVLNIRMRESLREDNGGVYGVGVFASLGRVPVGAYSSGFGFSCDPAQADTLVKLGLLEIASLQEDGPRPADVQKVKETMLRAYEKGMKENEFWLSNLSVWAQEGRDFEEILSYRDRVRAFDPRDAQRAAQLYFDMDSMLVAYLTPNYEE